MHKDLREFVTQYLHVVLFTLAPVILTTFFSLPYWLEKRIDTVAKLEAGTEQTQVQ